MLSTQQKNAFDRDGFLVIENVFSPEILNAVRNEYTRRLTELQKQWQEEGALPAGEISTDFAQSIKNTYQAGLDYFQPLDISLPPGNITRDTPFHAGPAIFNLMTYAPLLNIVESMIGPEITSNPIQHVRIKPPATQLTRDEIRPHITSTDWHQDRAVTLEEADETRMVTVWVAITDATVENGCLQAVPGSHKGKMLPHCPQSQLGIPKQFFNEADAKPLPVGAGGIVMFDPLTVHGSLANTTEGIRWSFDLRYNVTGDATGRPMFPEFVVRSQANPALVLSNAAKWRQLWCDAREQLANDAPVQIHRWPGDAEYCA